MSDSDAEAKATPLQIHRDAGGNIIALTAPLDFVQSNYDAVLGEARRRLDPGEKQLQITTDTAEDKVLFVPPGVNMMSPPSDTEPTTS